MDETARITQAAIEYARLGAPSAGAQAPKDTLVFRADAQPPFDKYQFLRRRERDFKLAADHKRANLAEDGSIEGDDAVLVKYAVADGWTDQEVFDLLVYHHREWCMIADPLPDKAIIVTARQRHSVPQPVAVVPIRGEERPNAETAQSIARLRQSLGVPVARVRKLGGRRGVFELVLDDGSVIELGTAAALLSVREVQAAVIDAGWPMFESYRGQKWAGIVDLVVKSAIIEEIAADPGQETAHWLRAAMAGNGQIILDRANPAEMAGHLRRPAQPLYLGRGEMFVCLPALIRNVHVNAGVRPTWPDMALRLRRLGFRPEMISARDKDGVAKARLWTSPRGFTLDE